MSDDAKHDEQEVAVAVITVSGIFPGEDTLQRLNADLPISHLLKLAAAGLNLTNTEDWVVRVGSRELAVQETFKKARLRCVVDVEWMPREGGGGA